MPIFAKFAAAIFAAGAVLAAAVAALSVPAGMIAEVGSGEPDDIELGNLAQRSYIYAADGSVLATLHGEQNRQPIHLSDVPGHVTAAIVAVEDAGFWVHDGVDARGMLRALRVNVDAGGISQGGSTITQQLVKLDQLTSEQTIDRKVEEIVLALRLERELTKEEILSRYLNTVYFGNHAYGIQAAAETYFGVSTEDLTVDQAALLAGIIRNPIVYDPIEHPERAEERREVALERMVDEGHVSEDEAFVYALSPLPTELHEVNPRPSGYFAEAVKSRLLRDPRLGETYEERMQAVFQGGLHIHTTFDPRAQQQAVAARDANLPLVNGVFAAGTDPETGEPRFGSAAVVSVEPSSGAIRSMVAGPEDDDYNLVTLNRRNPGSSFKTFVLTTLLEQGHSPEDRVNGIGTCRFANPQGTPNPYEVQNFENSGGRVDTIRGQTLRSSNCAYVRLGLIAGIGAVRQMAIDLGVRGADENEMQPVISLPLGTASVTPLEMASAYATLANDGVHNPPYMIERVEDSQGRTVITHEAAPERVVSPETARLVTSVLHDNVRSGTGRAAAIRTGHPAAGKTGTHQGSRDAWFVGYSRLMSTAVWVGGLGEQFTINLGGRGITGGGHPARIWGDYMTAWHEGQPVEGFPAPPARPGGDMLEVSGGRDLTPQRGRQSGGGGGGGGGGAPGQPIVGPRPGERPGRQQAQGGQGQGQGQQAARQMAPAGRRTSTTPTSSTTTTTAAAPPPDEPVDPGDDPGGGEP